MGGAPILLALALVSIDYGYKPDGSGGLEYIVQIQPDHLAMLTEAGQPIECPIGPEIQGHVSRLVIQLGTGALPRDDGGLRNQLPPRNSANLGAAPVGTAVMPKPSDLADNGPVPIPTLATDSLGQVSATSVQRPQSDANANNAPILPSLGEAAEKLREAGARMMDNSLRLSGNTPAPVPVAGPSLQLPATINPPSANTQYTVQNNTPASGGFGYNPLGGSILPGNNATPDYNNPANSYNANANTGVPNTAATGNASGRDSSNWRSDQGRQLPSTNPYTPDTRANASTYPGVGQAAPNGVYGVSNDNQTLAGTNAGLYPPATTSQPYGSTPDAYGNYPSLNTGTSTNNYVQPPANNSAAIGYRDREDSSYAGRGTGATSRDTNDLSRNSDNRSGNSYATLPSEYNQYTSVGDRPTYPGNQNYANSGIAARSDVWGSAGVNPINNLSLAANSNATPRNDYLDNGQPTNAGAIRPPAYNQSSYDLIPNGNTRLGSNQMGVNPAGTKQLGSRQPFSLQALYLLLLVSLVGNWYMGMSIGRLLKRYRDLAASVRGTVSV